MSYYKDQQIAFKDLDNTLNILKDRKEDVDINFIIYEATKIHPVSSKLLKGRIISWANMLGIQIVSDTIKFSKGD